VAGFNHIEWPVWIGTGGRFASEYAASIQIPRANLQQVNQHEILAIAQTSPAKLVDLLRLLKNSQIYVAFNEERRTISRIFPQDRIVSWPISLRLHSQTAVLGKSDAAHIIRLWGRLQKSPNVEKISLALHRWSATAERLNDEDKLIDYWIALESLFTPDSSQELVFRASLRIAAFLGQAPDERREIYDHMRHSYAWRSAIVHGDYRKKRKVTELNKKGTLSEVSIRTRSYLSKAILRVLESDEIFDPDNIESDLLARN
jgi:hypothetical protein